MTGEVVLAMPDESPEMLDELAATCLRVAAAATGLVGAVRGDRQRLAGCWTGRAATACDAEVAAVAALLDRLDEPLGTVAALLRALADEVHLATVAVAALRQEYDDVVLVHRASVAAVASAEGLPLALLRLRVEDAEADCAADLAAVRARHQAVLARVAAATARTAARIESVVADARPVPSALPVLAAARAAVPAGTLPPATASPRQVRRWWRLLTADERHDLAVRRAAGLGALDGVPLQVRAAANELQLARDIARWSRERPGAGRPPWLLGTCLAVADALALARSRRDPVTGRPLAASLLVYRPAAFGGQGRVAVAVGDLDRVDNVAVLVPGLGTTVGGSLRGLTATATRVTGLARLQAPRERTATIAWTAYDAPNLPQVAGTGAATAGARLLTSDLRGLRAAGAATHLTAVGHSYGSTTVGTALRSHGSGVDDVVLLGSPGAGVERASSLRVPDGHVWVGAASRDPVSYLDRFGTDPSHERFGATRFRAEDPARHPVALSLGDHSRYFAPGSESLDNVVRVVVGDEDAVSVATYRRETPWLPDGIATDPEADRDVTARGSSW